MTDGHPVRNARSHPLLRPFPLLVFTFATFLVVFTLLMARAHTFPGALAPAGVTRSILSPGGQRLVVKTTPSGRVMSAAAPAVSEPRHASSAPLVTSSSGAGAGDD